MVKQWILTCLSEWQKYYNGRNILLCISCDFKTHWVSHVCLDGRNITWQKYITLYQFCDVKTQWVIPTCLKGINITVAEKYYSVSVL